jgi:hypothetical protein
MNLGNVVSDQKPAEDTPEQPMTNRQAYNLVTDTVGGPNVRLKDNLCQGLAILICLFLGAGIGFLAISDGLMGVLLGGFIGLLVGLFGSGIFLMILRAVKHARGRHD